MPEAKWRTWGAGARWSKGTVVAAGASDTIRLVGVVTTGRSSPIELIEQWTPGELKLLDVQASPEDQPRL